MKVKVGQVVTRTPQTIQALSDKPGFHLESRPMRGRVVYVHPKDRFHVVEFMTPGGPIRESFAGAGED